MKIQRPRFGVFLFVALVFTLGLSPALARQAAVASAHPMATQAGLEILQAGGNAFDAAVAVSAVLYVVEPYGSGIGGGGFWLLRTQDGKEVMLDGRETAPGKAHRDMYLDDDGNVIPGLSINGPLAAGIPGSPAALVYLAEKYGSKPLKELLQPAIDAARNGFPADDMYLRMAGFRKEPMQASEDASRIFLKDGELPDSNDLIIQEDLAKTFELMAEKGHAGFYEGELAEKLVNGVQEAGGIWTLEDLKNYRVVERDPIRFEWKGMSITSVAPPSSGGIAMAEILNQLEPLDFSKMSETDLIHWISESMRRAYRDRAEYLGDTDFVDVPAELLTSKHYAAGLRQSIRTDRATPSESLSPTQPDSALGDNTTHFSVMDGQGNWVSSTMSVNYPFGSGFVPPGTGVLLNDEMDDFSSKPGEPNVYGLVGAEANAIEPGKRMLSSMSPTFVQSDDRVALIGTPGGSRIITMVTLGVMAFEGGANAEDIVNMPRFHHQYLPDRIQFEPGAFSSTLQSSLETKGHALNENSNTWGNMQVVLKEKASGRMDAASDERGIGQASVIELK